MKNHSLWRLVWKVSLPVIFVQATETFDHLIDTIFLARVGVTELGAIAVADSVLYLVLVLPLALADGIQILTARRAGQRRPDAVGALFNQGFVLVLLVCLAAAVVLKLLAPVVGPWVVESGDVGVLVEGYLQIEAYGLCFIGATFAYSALLVSLGRTWALVPATVILMITDLVLNYLFILGKFGFPALGMRGAAVGSVGAEFVTFLFLSWYVWRRLDASRYGFFRFRRFERRTTDLLSRLSAPLAVEGLLETVSWFLFFLILERVSTQALAISNIVYTCFIVFWIPTEAFSETTCSMVSRFVGRQWVDRIGEVPRNAIGGAILATIPFIVVALVVPDWFVAVFSPGSDLLSQSNASLRVAALAMLFAIPGEMWLAAVLGTGDTTAALGIELVFTLTMLGITYLSAIHLAWPVEFVWMSMPIAWLVCLIISYAWMKSGIWNRIKI